MVRTRIAPSPTGFPHIGTIYQALFNFAYARKNNGKFLVRIEDTDRARFVEGAREVIFSSLDWFGLTEDESVRKGGEAGPYQQSERLPLYHKYAQELLDNGHAYFAYYPKDEAGKKKEYVQHEAGKITQSEEIPPKTIAEMLERGDWIVRMKVPKDKQITFRDEIRGEITFESNQVTDQVLIKSDGFPTYHLAVVVDDHLMGITHIVRGEEWISSTPKHVLLYDYFGWEKPLLYHTPDLRNPDKSKLSKRHGHTNVNWYREEGYLPEAILNFLALQGWTHPEEKEIFSLDEFIQIFDVKDIRPGAPIFDLTKLTWMNQQYIQGKSDKELAKLIGDFFPKAHELPEALFQNLMPLVKSRMETLRSFEQLTNVFFAPPPHLEESKDVAQGTYGSLEKIQFWTSEHILAALRIVLQSHAIRMSVLYKLFTGEERGLPLPETLELLGKKKTLSYIAWSI